MTDKPVVAASDGSREALRAVEWAAREAMLRGAPLRIVSAASLPKVVLLQLRPERDAALGFVRQYRGRPLAAAAARAAEMAPGLLIDTDPVEGQAGGHRQRVGCRDAGGRLPRDRRVRGDGARVGR